MPSPLPKKDIPFLGASAPWIDEDEATYEHVQRQVADFLRGRLLRRASALNTTDLYVEEIAIEIRRQMAECAVDGDLVRASDLAEGLLSLLSLKDDRQAL